MWRFCYFLALSITSSGKRDWSLFFLFPGRIFWFYLRLSTIIEISTDFERESILILECHHEWRWVFRHVLPKSNEHSTSPTLVGTWTLGGHRGTAALLPSLVGYWKGWRSIMWFFLSELWWLYRELKGLSMNIPWEGLCSQVSCSNTSIPLEEILTLPNKSKHALSHRTVPVHWLMEKFSVYGFLGSIYRVTKTSSKATSYAGKILWSHTLKFCFSWGHLNTVWRETRVDNKVQSKRPCAFLISGLLCVSLVLWYKPKWHVSVMGGTKIMLQFVLLYITPLLTAAEAWHEGPWNICIRKTATP